jgi:hypothetical protein
MADLGASTASTNDSFHSVSGSMASSVAPSAPPAAAAAAGSHRLAEPRQRLAEAGVEQAALPAGAEDDRTLTGQPQAEARALAQDREGVEQALRQRGSEQEVAAHERGARTTWASTASTNDLFHSVASFSSAPRGSEPREEAHTGPESVPPESQQDAAGLQVINPSSASRSG